MTLHEELDTYIQHIHEYTAFLDPTEDPGRTLRPEVYRILYRLSWIYMHPSPEAALNSLVTELEAGNAGRPVIHDPDLVWTAPPGQVVFRYREQIVKDVRALLTRTHEGSSS